MSRSGFTLVEILVAVVILEVGLLSVVGTLWLAARTLTRAEVLERGVEGMEGVYDSLVLEAIPGSGSRPVGPGRVEWLISGGDLHVQFLGTGGDTLGQVEARIPVSPGLRP